MGSTGISRNGGDAADGWAAVCADFGRTRTEAGEAGLTRRWQRLVDSTRRGQSPLDDWVELIADIAEYQGDEDDFATRRGQLAKMRVEADIHRNGGFRCPKSLCGRRVVAAASGKAPRCELLGEAMAAVE